MFLRLIQRKDRQLSRCRVHRHLKEGSRLQNTLGIVRCSSSLSNGKKSKNQEGKVSNGATRSVLHVILENQRKFREQQAPYAQGLSKNPLQSAPVPTKDPRNGETLFDVFPVPTKIHRKSNAFPEEEFLAYESIIQDIIANPDFRKMHKRKPIKEADARPVEQWLTSDVPLVKFDVPSFLNAVEGGKQPKMVSEIDQAAASEVREQKRRFMETMDFSQKQYEMMAGALFKMANTLAKTGNGQPMPVMWEKIKEAGISDKGMIHNVLYVTATFPSGQANSSAKRKSKYGHLTGLVSILDVIDATGSRGVDISIDDDSIDLVDQIAIYHDLLHKPTEQSINIRMKLLVAQGKAQEADTLLQEQEKITTGLHLRVFRPLLRLHLELGDSASALRLFGRMLKLASVILDAETYLYVLHGLAKNGNFREDAKPLEGLSGSGFSNTAGLGLFDEVATYMSEEIIDIPDNMAKLLRSGLAESFPECLVDDSSPLAPLPLASERKHDALLADRVIVPNDSGVCPVSGIKLRLIQISDNNRLSLIDSLLSLSKVTYQNYIAKQGNMPNKSPDEHLKSFYEWLDERKGLPFTTIVDGANVGYYQQNFNGGRFSFHQIEFVVDSLRRLGETPLVILPLKYSREWFIVSDQAAGTSTGQKQTLSEAERNVQRNLLEQQCLYFVPSTFLDDFYWILASVSSQRNSRQGRDLTVPPDSPDGRWPGTRPVLVTNDQMRDHQVEMLGPMLFRRWYSNCIVNYNFFPIVNERQNNDSIGFYPADFFSREIQSNQDENGKTVWHFPLKGKEHDFFCLKLPSKTH